LNGQLDDHSVRDLTLGRNQAHSNRATDQARDIINAKPLHQLRAMRFNRLHTQLKLMGDFLGAVTFRDQLQDFPLTMGQIVGRFGSLADAMDIISDHLS